MQKAKVVIVGGGLAGLTAAIHLAKNNISTILFEKDEFPHHKVCGEYLSKEILPYLLNLGIPLHKLDAVAIRRLLFSTANGKSMEAPLPLGGLGISRYALDNLFYQEALKAGVSIKQRTVTKVEFMDDMFRVTAGKHVYYSTFVLGAFGKRSLLDKTLERSFQRKNSPWLALKSHYHDDSFPEDLVALHNFKGGYCGLSKTETGAVNLCYLASYSSFKAYKDPERFEKEVLRKNPFLNEFLTRATPVFEKPLSIAQISFHPKASVEDHIFFLGDAAGLIHPLCGNGMAMAIHSAKLVSELLVKTFDSGSIDRTILEAEYLWLWDVNFSRRMKLGKYLQKVLLNQTLATASQQLISRMPFILPQIIKNTHGRPVV